VYTGGKNESIAADTIYLDTPAVEFEATIAQVCVGVESLVTNVYASKIDQQFINTGRLDPDMGSLH